MSRGGVPWKAAAVLLALVALSSCRGAQGLGAEGCSGACASASYFLSASDVERILAQGAFEAQARGAKATLAVIDRSGNILGLFRMSGADQGFDIRSGRGVRGGLEEARLEGVRLPASFAAIAKATTAAYLSSEGNAFSTRTASQIIQENFNPKEFSQPSGPLYGVQFSQLPCSDIPNPAGTQGPKASPIGFAGDAGGLPLYKDGRLVGAVGVMSDSLYDIDLVITDDDVDQDELIAVAAAFSFMAPPDRRGDRITADGRTFRFTDSEELASKPANAPPLRDVAGELIAVPGFFDGTVRRGTAFNAPESGFRADTGALSEVGGHIVVDSRNENRFPSRAGTDGLLTAAEVTSILKNSLRVTNRTRAQVRRPLGSAAHATAVVVDTNGVVIGLARTADGLVDATDVTVQKARTSAFLSRTDAAALLQTIPAARYAASGDLSRPGDYVERLRAFLNNPNALSDGLAYSTRSIGNLHRPYFPDGVEGTPEGPLSKPLSSWSPFNVGLQLDLVNNAILGRAQGVGCAFLPQIPNGITIFPGGFPIYRGTELVGAVGASGDGVDQDDMIAFLGLAYAARELNTGIGHAPRDRRSDILEPRGLGTRLRYVQCPQSPFLDSTEQNVCAAF